MMQDVIGTDCHSVKQAWLQQVTTKTAAVKRRHHTNSDGFYRSKQV